MAYIYDLADTWSGGGAFTGIKLNVTDSGSTAGSLLMDLQVGGLSKFTVRKDGRILAGNAHNSTNFMEFIPVTNSLTVGAGGIQSGGIRHITGSSITLLSGSAYSTTHATDAILNGALGLVGWHSSTYSFQNLTPDLALYRDAANTLAQRNGLNSQAFHLYNTFTDANNHERFSIKWDAGVVKLGNEAAGTGSIYRLVEFWRGGVKMITLTSGEVQIDGGALRLTNAFTPWLIIPEDSSPPTSGTTNNAIIYAEDDGTGKTRLMARFATGAPVQIAIEP